jgi:hypothetical protein
MKLTAPRKKVSDVSSQDDFLTKRAVKTEGPAKRDRKPSIYDELDDDDYVDKYQQEYGFDEDEDDYIDEEDEEYDDEDDDER